MAKRQIAARREVAEGKAAVVRQRSVPAGVPERRQPRSVRGRTPWWSSKTDNKGATQCITQTDGNLVIYSSPNKAIWSSGTAGKRRSFLWIQDHRNLVIYQPVWATNTSV